jgi:hypothetical protein
VEVKARLFIKIILWTVITALVLPLFILSGKPCNPPPQEEKLISNQTIVIYSPGYKVSFYGIEKLHPFDIGKYDRIADYLVKKGCLIKRISRYQRLQVLAPMCCTTTNSPGCQ